MWAQANKLLLIVLVTGLAAAPCLAAGPAPRTPAPTAAPAPAPPVTAEQVATAIQKLVASLRGQCGVAADNNNAARGVRMGGMQGYNILNLLALVNAGVNINDPVIAKNLPAVAALPDDQTYTVSLKCQLLSVTDPKTYAAAIKASVQWLEEAQLDNGMWTYGKMRGGGDNSNTQFALLGLHEAAKVGIPVRGETWARSQKHFENTQYPDGGWTYVFSRFATGRGDTFPTYGSMTAAGVASLLICGQRLNVGGAKVFVNGAYPSCGNYKQNRPIAAGVAWLTNRFSVVENPGHGQSNVAYYRYALERVGMISGIQSFGTHDWYREGAAQILSELNGGAQGMPRMFVGFGGTDSAFHLLFLAKGNRPVLIQKLRWKGERNVNDWSRNLHDLENLTAFIGDKLGKAVTWQTASPDQPLEELRLSPLLFITGHEFPKFTVAQKLRLRQYVETGGVIICDACCGSKDFREGFRRFAQETFEEYPCRPLGLEHPVFRSYYEIENSYGLEGIDVGCRTGVFFSPNAMSCLMELQDYQDSTGKWSLNVMRLATNMAAYATGKEMLADRLDKVVLPTLKTIEEEKAESTRGAVRLGRLVHNGDYNADPRSLMAVSSLMRQKARVDVVSKAQLLKANDPEIGKFPVIFMTGHQDPKLGSDEVKALRTYLDRGGFLLAEACCGKPTFDAGFRELVKQLYPEEAMKELPDDHPLYRAQVGLPLGEMRFRKVLADQLKTASTRRPPLESVVVKGRTTILYTPYDFTCALEGDKSYSCRGYIEEDAERLALDLFLYAIGY